MTNVILNHMICVIECGRGENELHTTPHLMIRHCGEEILSLVLRRVKETKVYSIGFDTTMHVSIRPSYHRSQFNKISVNKVSVIQ